MRPFGLVSSGSLIFSSIGDAGPSDGARIFTFANWSIVAFIVTIAVLVLGNNTEIPISVFSAIGDRVVRREDAMIQWWYGHNAVGFFLKRAFWASLLLRAQARRAADLFLSLRWCILGADLLYIWAGPHHLHYTALARWAQTLGMVFSVKLGCLLGHDQRPHEAIRRLGKMRTDPVLRNVVRSPSRMSTFEGPLMSVKAVNSLSHYTDWDRPCAFGISAGSASVSFGALYCLIVDLEQELTR